MELMIETVAEYLGMSVSTMGIILVLSVAIFISLSMYIFTRSIRACLIASNGVLLFGVIIGWIPVWILIIVFIPAFGIIFLPTLLEIGGGESSARVIIEDKENEEADKEEEIEVCENTEKGIDVSQQLW